MSDEPRNPYMRLWINDARSSCQIMSAAQFGAHMRMLMHGWERGHVPADDRLLRRIVGDIDWAEMPEVLDRWQQVTLDDGTEVFINPRQERERERVIKEGNRRRESGRKGAERRWGSKDDGNDDGNGHGNDDGENMAFPNAQTLTSQMPVSQTPVLSSDGDKAPSKRRKKRITDDPLRWTEPDGWIGVTDEDHAKWAELYPAVDSRYELKRLDRWLRDNPTKAHKSHWRRWVNKLFGIKQDKGGSSGAGRVEPNAAPRRHEPDRSHIPEDCAPGQDHLFWDGTFPNIPSTYTDTAGNLRHTRTRKIICAAEA